MKTPQFKLHSKSLQIKAIFLLFLSNITLGQLNKDNAILTFELQPGKELKNYDILFTFKVSLQAEIQNKRKEIASQFNPLTLDFEKGSDKGEDKVKNFKLEKAVPKENFS